MKPRMKTEWVRLTRQTRERASGNGNRNPDSMLRNMEPGMAKDCRLSSKVKDICVKRVDEHLLVTMHFQL